MPSPRIIAYAFNASVCCPACTGVAFDNGELNRNQPPFGEKRSPPRHDQHNLPDDLVNVDYEPVQPIFSTDNNPDGHICDDCGAHIL